MRLELFIDLLWVLNLKLTKCWWSFCGKPNLVSRSLIWSPTLKPFILLLINNFYFFIHILISKFIFHFEFLLHCKCFLLLFLFLLKNHFPYRFPLLYFEHALLLWSPNNIACVKKPNFVILINIEISSHFQNLKVADNTHVMAHFQDLA